MYAFEKQECCVKFSRYIIIITTLKTLYFFNIHRYNLLSNKKENKKKAIVIFDKSATDRLMLNLPEKRSWSVYTTIWTMKMASKKCLIISIRNTTSRNILVIVTRINSKIEYRKKANDTLKTFHRVRKKKPICPYNTCLDNSFVCFLIQLICTSYV